MANDFVIRISADANAPTALPRINRPHYEIDHSGVGKVNRTFDAYADLPRIARSFEFQDREGPK
jgi:hypothetical protein